MVVSMIVVLKVGGFYVFIDVIYFNKCIEFIIEDVEVVVVFIYGKIIFLYILVIKIEDIDNIENNKRLNIEYVGNLEDDMYYIYIFGIIGKFKVVLVK